MLFPQREKGTSTIYRGTWHTGQWVVHSLLRCHRTDWTRPRPGDPGNLCHQPTRRGCYTRDAILETTQVPHRLQQVCHTDGRQGARLFRQFWSSPSGRCAGSTELYDTRPLPVTLGSYEDSRKAFQEW